MGLRYTARMVSLEYAVIWALRPVFLLLYMPCAAAIILVSFALNRMLGAVMSYLALVILVLLLEQLRQMLRALRPSHFD